ncbi:MAG TPA: DALR domain-containing protein, partial [Rhodanobacteraceae bacterium]|nr:DALR domain-containing protein [Rhodanobacteraceae bacterium]
HPPEAIRYALLSAHYRQPLDWSDALIGQSIATLDRLYGVLRDLSDVDTTATDGDIPGNLENALLDDLNTPEALAELAKLADAARHAGSSGERRRTKAALLAGGALLGLLQQDPETWFKRGTGDVDAARVESLIEARQAARAARDFARADAIRDELAAMGIAIEDGPQGTRWRVAER